jgi:hypothetical protein
MTATSKLCENSVMAKEALANHMNMQQILLVKI